MGLARPEKKFAFGKLIAKIRAQNGQMKRAAKSTSIVSCSRCLPGQILSLNFNQEKHNGFIQFKDGKVRCVAL